METPQLIVSPAPHIRARQSTAGIMWMVVTSLIPAAAAGVVLFGRQRCCYHKFVLAAVLAGPSASGLGRRITVGDRRRGYGLLLALTLPRTAWWMTTPARPAIIIGKQVFGGLGHNLFNPALAGRAFLLASWPGAMMTWKWPAASLSWAGESVDAIGGATGLGLARQGFFAKHGVAVPYSQLFMGNIAGSLGETSALALLIGAVFLLAFRVIDWRIPLGYLGTLAILALLAGQDPIFHLLTGGVLLGAFFMATDYVTTPITPGGRFFFGLGCGVLTFLIRIYGGYPEGVTYAILLMNAAAPLLEKATIPKRFGEVRADV